jgi:Holliday junction DNA helicase RuvA
VVAAIGEDLALIDVNGVGYVIQAGSRTLARMSVGDAAVVYCETHVREDAIKLFGFLSEEDRAWFAHLQSAPGVGAKVALNIVDALTPAELADAVALQDKASGLFRNWPARRRRAGFWPIPPPRSANRFHLPRPPRAVTPSPP